MKGQWMAVFSRNFCWKHDILIPNMNAPYIACKGRACRQHDEATIEHSFRVEIYSVTISKQLHELNDQFKERAGTFTCVSILEPKDGFEAYDIDRICILTAKDYRGVSHSKRIII